MQNQALTLTTKTGTTNMAVIICVEKDQSTELDLDDFINAIQDQIPNFFEQATFGNYHVNVINILVKSIDYLNRKAYAFELPDTIVAKPSTFDTSYCVRPWMVKNILKQADSIYNFADYDSDGDGIVDFCMFQVARFRIYANDGTGAVGTGTTGLSIDSYYTTDDTLPNGTHIRIDGTGYGGYAGRRAIIQRAKWASADHIVKVAGHELGHALFGFPDMDHGGISNYNHYALGDFSTMSVEGFNDVASVYNPLFRINEGWLIPTIISSSSTKTFQDIDATGSCYEYDLPNYPSSVSGEKFYFSYYTKPAANRWQSQWPIPKDAQGNSRGILIWRINPNGYYSNRYNMPITIESAHGKWDWNHMNDEHHYLHLMIDVL